MSQTAQASTKAGADLPSTRTLKNLIRGDRPYVLYAAFAVLIVAFSLASPVFFSSSNFLNIGRQTALVTIIAVGMTFVIIAGEIDLSVASTLALSGMSAAMAIQQSGGNWLIGTVAGLATGAVVGLVNGLLTTRLSIPSFLVTLGMLGIGRGIALMLTGTTPVVVNTIAFWDTFGEGAILGIPAPIFITLLVLGIGAYLLHFSTFGRKVFATGGNATAARYSGINTRRAKTVAFVITGALAGLAGLILTARAHAARPDIAAGLELDVIAAVILGGTSLFGGRGAILGTLLGSLMIGVLNNGLTLMGVSSQAQLVVKGAIIIAAVAFSRRK
ncbi:ABC transporter permease [Arthrobacter sp. efr-133-TYG-120]|uniref:ABC transporter permease n=1 Tax=Arthrobacter sp. efr-133-TYG-120 TaxID=3040280 RepID=UPI00254C958B|nr:ABC transporter permease [Arthrobacter sp. efr-133-TYG-120]